MVVSSYISPKASKGGPSTIVGRGLVAVAPIARDELVAIKGGHIVDSATLHALPERLANSDVQIADGFHLVALDEAEYEPVMLFINHSCEPNVGFAGNIVLVAMRDIGAGEELTTDYALFDDYDGEMECRCATASCRGTIGGRDWQRPELQRRYGDYFSWYLRRRIEATLDDAGSTPPPRETSPPRLRQVTDARTLRSPCSRPGSRSGSPIRRGARPGRHRWSCSCSRIR